MEINLNNYPKEEVIKARETLTKIKNLSILMKLLFKTPAEIMKDRNCTLDKALELQNKTYNYVKKYAEIHTVDAVEKIRPIIEQLLYDIKKQEENK